MSSKKLLTTFEKIILFGCLGFLAFSFLKNSDGGVSIIETSEETTIVDGKTSANTYREFDEKEKRDYSTADSKTDDIISELARTFSDGKNAKEKMQNLGLSEDEQKYYKNVKEKNELNNKIESAKDWWNVLTASAETYGKVKSMFNEADGNDSKTENVTDLLQDAKSANDFYKKLKSTFNISEEDAQDFANKGSKAVSDWVEFIEKNEN